MKTEEVKPEANDVSKNKLKDNFMGLIYNASQK